MVEKDRKYRFGFDFVDHKDKINKVLGVFDSVAQKYDIMNDCMSLGVHRLWKRRFVEDVTCDRNAKVIDVAGGTGDIAYAISKRFPDAKVIISDINSNMLQAGINKHLDKEWNPNIDWMCCSAENMPFKDNTFDCYTISFGMRNVADVDAALREAHRILVPGGKFLCLEFAEVSNSALSSLYDMYSYSVLPFLGQFVAGDREAYEYLADSIRTFPNQETYAGMIRDAGFVQVGYKNMTGGIVAIHSGIKL